MATFKDMESFTGINFHSFQENSKSFPAKDGATVIVIIITITIVLLASALQKYFCEIFHRVETMEVYPSKTFHNYYTPFAFSVCSLVGTNEAI